MFTGPSIGTLVAMGGVGLLCGSPLGWPSGFYVPGVLALVWGVFWMRMSADSPAKCKRISAEERDYIIASLGDSSSNDKVGGRRQAGRRHIHICFAPIMTLSGAGS